MIESIIWLLIYLLVLGLVFYLVVWVLGILGIAIPPNVMKIVGAIIFLIVLLWFISAIMGGAGVPRLRL